MTSKGIFQEKNLPTIPIKPIKVGQAFEGLAKSTVDRKVCSHVPFRIKGFTKKTVDIPATLLKRDEAFGMPSLQPEGIVTDAAAHDIIVCKANCYGGRS